MGDKQAGWEHFHRADWADARAQFASALEGDPGDPEALDGLGQSLWWLGERDAGIDCRREAYAAYKRRGVLRDAGRLAIYLAGEARIDGQHAAAAGWLARARRLLAGQGRVSELGWLAIEEAKRTADPVTAEHHARTALEVANELADPDVECMALAQLGRAVVRQGRVTEGVGLLDEAMTVALAVESSDPLACGDACCDRYVAGLTSWRNGDEEDSHTVFVDAIHQTSTGACAFAGHVTELQGRWIEQAGKPRRNSGPRRLIELLPSQPIVNVKTLAQLLGGSDERVRQAILRVEQAGCSSKRRSDAETAPGSAWVCSSCSSASSASSGLRCARPGRRPDQ